MRNRNMHSTIDSLCHLPKFKWICFNKISFNRKVFESGKYVIDFQYICCRQLSTTLKKKYVIDGVHRLYMLMTKCYCHMLNQILKIWYTRLICSWHLFFLVFKLIYFLNFGFCKLKWFLKIVLPKKSQINYELIKQYY